MKIKRNKLNEHILRGFLHNDGIAANGYSASFNGEKYFKLVNDSLYGPKCLFLRNDMGWTIIGVNDNNIEELAIKIQETLLNLDDIIKSEKAISDYCSKNPWTYSGT